VTALDRHCEARSDVAIHESPDYLPCCDNCGMKNTLQIPLLTLWRPILAMLIVIVASNYLVQFPINDWLTWGAFTFPIAFLVTDLTNRAVGAQAARRVAWTGFAIAVLVSLAVAPWRIAVASGVAFIVGQLLDIVAFNKLRAMSWWKAPLIGSVVASVVDTGIFFFLAFAGSDMNWLTLAAGDLGIKWLMAAALLAPYRIMLPRLQLWVPVR
jgi:queuosine precursor transporter